MTSGEWRQRLETSHLNEGEKVGVKKSQTGRGTD